MDPISMLSRSCEKKIRQYLNEEQKRERQLQKKLALCVKSELDKTQSVQLSLEKRDQALHNKQLLLAEKKRTYEEAVDLYHLRRKSYE